MLLLASGLSVPEPVSATWASASTSRGSDKRGGANGARMGIRFLLADRRVVERFRASCLGSKRVL
jgi:catalase (peroxidase I)